ncbi:hypothetical protein SUNI508_00758 [Seiridium unicorne]|uniref:Uncharacterized protein n=1 Tax=Seiridium unicorne TaxID=138068 RepID=A0ABR2V161_9PEZI
MKFLAILVYAVYVSAVVIEPRQPQGRGGKKGGSQTSAVAATTATAAATGNNAKRQKMYGQLWPQANEVPGISHLGVRKTSYQVTEHGDDFYNIENANRDLACSMRRRKDAMGTYSNYNLTPTNRTPPPTGLLFQSAHTKNSPTSLTPF